MISQNIILHEDSDILVCHKPAGIATQTARVGQADMVSEVIGYLASRTEAANKNPYLGVVHRLDQPVEGILVFAKNKTAAAALSRQAAGERMEKEYLAVVCGKEIPQSGELTDYLLKDGRTNTSRVVPSEVKDAKKAVLEYEVLEKKPPEEDDSCRLAFVRIRLHTGRHHQIRVQMANAGMSLLGDYKYADETALAVSRRLELKEIALCASRVAFDHPVTRKRMQFQITPEGAAFRKNFKQ
ncbi:MAG: RNA pseudouridine synthase [Lachnospiraceae bacterium]|nr:RNA pseudouridine synthase [Lachnospiraceae bacterium]